MKRFRDIYSLLLAMLIVEQMGLGWYMTRLDYYHRWYHAAPGLHKSIGMVVMIMVLLRIGARLSFGLPPITGFFRSLKRDAFGTNHLLLYILLLVITFSGYSFVTATGKGVSFFGLFEFPSLINWGKKGEVVFDRIHYFFVYGTALIILRHAVQRGRNAGRRSRSRRAG